jgi:hypothetical protein
MGGFAVARGSPLSSETSPLAAAMPPVPFFDAVQAGWDDQREVNNSDARRNALMGALWKRNQAVEKAAGKRIAPSDFMTGADRTADYAAQRMGGTTDSAFMPPARTDDDYETELEQLRAANPAAFSGVETRAQLKARVDRELGAIEQRSARAAGSGFKGAAGNFLGAAAASMTDPVNAVGLIYGGAGAERSLARTVIEQSVFNAALEAGQIPSRIADSHLAGPAYTPGRALEDVAAAGVGAGLFTLGGHLAGKALAPLFRKAPVDAAERGAVDVLLQGPRRSTPAASTRPPCRPTRCASSTRPAATPRA